MNDREYKQAIVCATLGTFTLTIVLVVVVTAFMNFISESLTAIITLMGG